MKGGDSYIFPILNHKRHIKPTTIDNRLVKVLGIVNGDLKDIAKLTKINEKLTTYVARHTFATVMKTSGAAKAMISEAMGHDSEKTTDIYLKSFEDVVLDEAVKNIL